MTARAPESPAAGLFSGLVALLTVAAAIELLVLRMFTRTAIHIPALHELAAPYRLLTRVGQFDYYVAAVSLVVALPVVMLTLGARSGRPGLVASAAVGVFVAMALLARVVALDPGLQAGLTASAVATIAAALLARNQRQGLALAFFAAAFTLAALDAVMQSLAQHGWGSLDGRPPLFLSEVSLTVFGLAAPFSFGARADRRTLILAAVAALLAFAMLEGAAPTTKILMLWNFGLTGDLPAAAYAAAIGALVLTLASLWRSRAWMATAGLILAVTGGIGMHSTYQSGLVVLGLAILLCAPPAGKSLEPQ